MHIVTMIITAGWPIWSILLTSIVALSIILERVYTLQTTRVLPKRLMTSTLHTYQNQGYNHTLAQTLQQSPFGQILHTALTYYSHGQDKAQDAMENTGNYVAQQLSRYLTTLGSIATIAPLLGLLGTVVGMIQLFGVNTFTAEHPVILAQGISIALYNTAFGIIVAVPSLLFYRYFRRHVACLLTEMEYQAFQFLEALKDHTTYSLRPTK